MDLIQQVPSKDMEIEALRAELAEAQADLRGYQTANELMAITIANERNRGDVYGKAVRELREELNSTQLERDAAIDDAKDYMALAKERDALRALLAECQWVTTVAYVNAAGSVRFCPVCHAPETSGHDEDCRIHAALEAK
jgi:chromosome segregation ATPase